MKKYYIFSLILLSLVLSAHSVSADTSTTGFLFSGNTSSYTLLEPLPCIEGTGNNCSNEKGLSTINKINVNQYISYMYKFSLALAVFLAIFMIIWGGFEYMLSEAITSKKDAKDRINHAVFGLVLALVSFLVLQTIDPRLVRIQTQLPVICPSVKPGLILNDKRSTVCDTATIQDFQKDLTKSLADLAVEKRNEAQEAQIAIDASVKRIAELNAKAASVGLTDTEKTELETLTESVKTQTAKQTSNILQSIGAKNFQLTLDTVQQKDAFALFSKSNTIKTGDDFVAKLTDPNGDYMKTAEILKAQGDYEGYQKALSYRDMYIDQIKEEVALAVLASDYVSIRDSYKSTKAGPVEMNVKDINNFMAKYKDPAKDPYETKYKNYPEVVQRYEQVRTARINYVDQLLKQPPK